MNEVFQLFLMDKMTKSKRIVKKRIQRRKETKKVKAKRDKDEQAGAVTNKVPVTSQMSRLEYEQAMFDPRFRAAMMGLNNPAGGLAAQQVNNQLRSQETKNNEMTRLITMEQELTNAKKREKELKEEYNQMKHEAQLEKMKQDAEARQRELIRNTEHLRQVREIETKNMAEKVTFNMEKHAWEKKEADLRNQLDAQKRDAQRDKLEHEKKLEAQKHEYEKQLNTYEHELNATKQSRELEKQKFENAESIAAKSAELALAKGRKETEEQTLPLQEKINDVNRYLTEMKAAFDNLNRVRDAQKEAMLTEFQSQFRPYIDGLNANTAEIRRQMDLNNAVMKDIEEFKKVLFEKSQLEIEKAASERTQLLQAQLSEERAKNALQKREFEEKQKQDELSLRIKLSQQTTDPETRREANEAYENEALKTNQKRLALEAFQDVEEVRKKGEEYEKQLRELTLRIFPDETVDIDDPDIMDKITKKKIEFDEKNKALARQADKAQEITDEHDMYKRQADNYTQRFAEFMEKNKALQTVAVMEGYNTPADQIAHFEDILKAFSNLADTGAEQIKSLPGFLLNSSKQIRSMDELGPIIKADEFLQKAGVYNRDEKSLYEEQLEADRALLAEQLEEEQNRRKQEIAMFVRGLTDYDYEYEFRGHLSTGRNYPRDYVDETFDEAHEYIDKHPIDGD